MSLNLLPYAHLALGHTAKDICPQCNSPKRTFSITRLDTGYVFNCYRNSCGYKGFIASFAGVQDTAPKPIRDHNYYGELAMPSERDLEYFETRFNLDYETTSRNIRVTGDSRYALAIRNRGNVLEGWTIRRPCWDGYDGSRLPDIWTQKPKTMKYAPPNSMAWYDNGPMANVLVIVEDQISAMRVGQLCPAVALMGTSLNDGQALELASFRADRYILALDPDAFHTAMKLWKRYTGILPNLTAAMLTHDPKDYDSTDWLIRDLGIVTHE